MTWGEHHSAKLRDPKRFAALQELAKTRERTVQFVGTVYVRNWPRASQRPFHVKTLDGSHICTCSTLDALEKIILK